ncbi:hypothetical protein INT47_001438, partial [Mucor saturninus]
MKIFPLIVVDIISADGSKISNGNPTAAVAAGTHRVKTEPWKFKEFLSEEIKNKEDKSTEVPQSRGAVIELVNMILSPHPIESITYEEFLPEKDLYELVKPYFAETNFSCNQLNDWLGKEGSWGSTKRKIVNGERLRGRTLHVIRPELRDFLWNDISNVKEFRKSVRESRHKTATIGYVKKSKTTKKEAVEKSINLQVAKMKKKATMRRCVCRLPVVFGMKIETLERASAVFQSKLARMAFLKIELAQRSLKSKKVSYARVQELVHDRRQLEKFEHQLITNPEDLIEFV